MGHTNSTANLSLPQFIGTDKPTWLGDVNGAFNAIDSKIGTIDADIAATDAKADNAVADAASAVSTATSANTTAGNASTTATNALNIANNALTVANNADGHTNQLETKVGLLADLHTTDKTSVVNAINETFDALPSAGEYVEVTGDGVKTFSQIGDELYALVDPDKVSDKSVIQHIVGTNNFANYSVIRFNGTKITSTRTDIAAAGADIYRYEIQSSGSKYDNITGSTYTDNSSSVFTSGWVLRLYY